jgi:hypothetical protein
MILLIILLVPIGLICLGWALDIYKNRHPLNPEEILELARTKQWRHLLAVHAFSSIPVAADASKKKAMKASGQFVRCDLGFSQLPSSIAGLLKYKKHEWVVLVFVKDLHAEYLWWNKGQDGTSVSPHLRGGYLDNALRLHKPDMVVRLHNHPNPDPLKYRVNQPSSQDLTSAEYFSNLLSQQGIAFMDFVCERGVPYLYYAFLSSRSAPIDEFIKNISKINDSGIFANVGLRRELSMRTAQLVAVRGGIF